MRSTDGGSTWADPFQASTPRGQRAPGRRQHLRARRLQPRGRLPGRGVAGLDRPPQHRSGEEEIVTRKLCTEPAHWSERSPTFSRADRSTVADGTATVHGRPGTAPDLYWGDGGENPAARKYQLWVDGALVAGQHPLDRDQSTDLQPRATATTHTYVVRAVNQCGVAKDYAARSFTATSCCRPTRPSSTSRRTGRSPCARAPAPLLTATPTGGTGRSTTSGTATGRRSVARPASTYTANDTGTHGYNCEVKGQAARAATRSRRPADPGHLAVGADLRRPRVGRPTRASATCTLNLSWSAATAGLRRAVPLQRVPLDDLRLHPRARQPDRLGAHRHGSPRPTRRLSPARPTTTWCGRSTSRTGSRTPTPSSSSATPTGAVTPVFADDFEGGDLGWVFDPRHAGGDDRPSSIGDPVGHDRQLRRAQSSPRTTTPLDAGVNCMYTAE